ncbi:hypothetical protein ACH5RR_004933 [Cinchona calisaya]|uniref:Legume lectin domain-containing protein n=1 Tax=Cinchona calisaya TaxID=153742 RepID=A0ABD3AZY2_9GENT
MASLSSSRYLTAIPFLLLYIKTVYSDFNVSFASKNVFKGPNFESMFAFYGDAKLVTTGVDMSVQLSGSVVPNSGRVLYKQPIKLFEGNPRKMVSFAMNFVFSLSSENGDGLAFVMAPAGYPVNVFDGGSFGLLIGSKHKFLAVEFDTLRDDMYGDMNGNHVGIDVDSLVSVKISNVSSVNLTLNSGEKLQTWIDYEANSKRLEVRLAKLGGIKPIDPLLYYPVDLSRMWDKPEVLFSLSSADGNSSQKCNLYSWSLKLRTIPQWMHSEPMDPAALIEKRKELKVHEKSDCALRILAALVFGTGCGALGALLVLFIWTLMGYKRPVVPEDYAVQPIEFDFKKAKVVGKPIQDGKNQLGA